MRERPRRPLIPIAPSSGPINRSFIFGSIAACGAWLTWPGPDTPWQQYPLTTLMALAGAGGVLTGVTLMRQDFRRRRNLALAQVPSDDHGAARESTFEERRARGMHDPQSGNLLGLDEGGWPIFLPPKTFLTLIEAPPGNYKTASLVTGSILHWAELGHSVVVGDIKAELAPVVAPALRARGFEVWCVNPAGAFIDTLGNVELNPYQGILDAYYGEGVERADTIKLACDYAEIHLPTVQEDKNKFFNNGSRRVIAVVIVILAVTRPDECTPTGVFKLLSNPARLVEELTRFKDLVAPALADDPVVQVIADEAANLLDRRTENPEHFGSFVEGASQALISFNESGRLAHVGRNATHNLSALRERQVVVIVVAPLSHSREFGPFLSLINANLIAACKANPQGHPLRIIGEEALNYRIASVSDFETIRGLRVSAELYIQSYAGLVRREGREGAEAVDGYADVKIYAGVNFERAKHVSAMLAEETILRQDYSYRSVLTDLNLSSREMGRRLMRPDEILTMPRDQAWVFVKGMRPVRIRLVPYYKVEPWRSLVGDHPVEGPIDRSGPPLLRFRYPGRTKP